MTPSSSSPVRRQPLVDQVLDFLQQQITTGAFPVGSKLPSEPELMLQLAVGRSTLREAMRVLAYLGLVDVRPGDGTYICASSMETESLGQRLQRARAIEVYEVRRTLELECVRLAAVRRNDEDLACLQQTLRERRAFLVPGCEQEFIEADLAFHMAIASATKNAVLADMYQAFVRANRASWEEAGEVPGLKEQGQLLHEQIAEAIRQRDPVRAEQLIEVMLKQSTERVQEILVRDAQIERTHL